MVKFGAQADIAGGLNELQKAINKVQREIRQNAEYALKEELEVFAPKLQEYLSKAFVNFYEQEVESEYYNRTGDITRTIKVKVTQGGGYYGLRLWFDQNELEVVITPKGEFNAHADYWGHPITVEELIGYESYDKKKDFLLEFEKLALDYVKEKLPKIVKTSFGDSQKFDIHFFELQKYGNN